MRELIYHKNVEEKDYTTTLWGEENAHLRELKKLLDVFKYDKVDGKRLGTGIETPGHLAASAVRSYFHRVAPRLILTAAHRIKGDLKTMTRHLVSTMKFVNRITVDGLVPFQYESGMKLYDLSNF